MSFSALSSLLDWRHLVEKPASEEEVVEAVDRGSVPSFAFYFMLMVSAVIATFGLLADSAAVIIGAMIIAPLMNPIVALSFSLPSGRRTLFLRSLLSVLTGTLLTVGAAAGFAEIIGWKLAGAEIISRMKPTLLDLGVAVAAGAAAAFAYTRPGVTSALAGIAISVALVPPLCTVGIVIAMGQDVSSEVGLAMNSYNPRGPLLLYFTNIIGILFAGGAVFFWSYFRRRFLSLLTLALTLGSLIVIIPPLGVSLDNLLIRNQVRRSLNVIGSSLLPEDSNARLTNLSVRIEQDAVYVRGDVVAAPGLLAQSTVDEIREMLSELVKRPVVLEFGITQENVLRSTSEADSD